LLAARPPVNLPNLSRWRSQGKVLTIEHALLSFTAAEISDLFSQQYHYDLTSDEVDFLYRMTEGWAIVLQLIWQNLRSGGLASVTDALSNQTTSLESLFNVLAHEVFEVQPADVQEFLRVSATLREMTVEACNVLRGATDSAAMLPYLRRQELFVVDLGDNTLRYHHIFHNFLRQRSTPEQRRQWHLQAAEYYRQRENFDATLYHLSQVDDADSIAGLLDTYGQQLLAVGRLDTLTAYLDDVPPEILHHHPMLLFFLGELARLRSRFQEAVGWYQQAENAWRERGQIEDVSRARPGARLPGYGQPQPGRRVASGVLAAERPHGGPRGARSPVRTIGREQAECR
jgi:ATP/maltotriose-dependent transcriptional regulator MalT